MSVGLYFRLQEIVSLLCVAVLLGIGDICPVITLSIVLIAYGRFRRVIS
jgi:hypothetical protein